MNLSRYTVFILCVSGALLSLAAALAFSAWWLLPAMVFGALTAIGINDLRQTRHAVRRNYPVIGRLRWLFEHIRPEIRQYLIEGDQDATPFTRSQRSLVYARAKGESSERPFGTQHDVYAAGHEFIAHSSRPIDIADPRTFRITIGNKDCKQPYSASIFNISAMSFGSLSANAIRALNEGAAIGGFAHDTGEGAISMHHRVANGDLIWEIGSGYFGCCDEDGDFSATRFAEQAANPQVKMIEIKLSQGAKPGHGGILPGAKVTQEIADARGVPAGVDCVSPATHSEFSTPRELMQFIARLRHLSGGKPIGFKLCIGKPWEFMGMVKAMLETGIIPDFIVVDGSEGGTGAAPLEFADHLGMPMREGLLFVHNVLTGAGLRDQVKIGAAGKITSGFDIAATMALGADWVNAGRGFMFALGCIQSLTCNTNRCPSGVATQDPVRQRALDVPDKAQRVARYHRSTMHALAEMIAAAGISHPSQLKPHHLMRRVSRTEVRLFSQLHVFIENGALLDDTTGHDFYSDSWKLADSNSFKIAS